jgi:hypothetical protein
MHEIAMSLLDTRLDRHKTYKEAITDHIRKINEADMNLFLKIYDQYVRYICNNRKYYLGAETEDCMQFIRMTLCKTYHKKYMYTNFDKVVKAVIKRKAIDFSKARNCDIRGLVNESDFIKDDGDNDTDLDDIGTLTHDKFAVDNRNTYYEFGKTIRHLVEKVCTNDMFTQWDRVLIKHIAKHVKNGTYDIPEILGKMKGDRLEVKFRYNVLVKRIKQYINKDLFI